MSFNRKLYAEIYARDNSTESVITTQDVWVQVSVFDSVGAQKVASGDSSEDHVTVPFDEVCFIFCTVSMCKAVGGGDDTFEFEIRKNNGGTVFNNLAAIRVIDSGAPGKDIGDLSMNGIVALSAGDTVEVWVRNTSSDKNLLIKDINLSVLRVS